MSDLDKNIEEPEKSEVDIGGIKVNKQTIDLLVANVIPTTKYFETRFDHMQYQIDRIDKDLNLFKNDVDRRLDDLKVDMKNRFELVDRQFDEVNRQLEQVDKRFEQVDKRFEQIIASIDKLADKLDHRDEKQRGFTLRMFTISITISIFGVLGAFLKSMGLI